MEDFKEEISAHIMERDKQCALHRKHRIAARQYKKHLQYLADNLKFYPSPAYFFTRNGKTYIRRLYNSKRKNSSAAAGKVICSRKVRKYPDTFPKGNLYRKVYDYWWTLW